MTAQEPTPDPSEIPEFDRVMRGLVNVDPAELSQVREEDAMKFQRQFWGVVRATEEQVEITERRKGTDGSTMHSAPYRETSFDGKPYYQTTDGREVRRIDEKYVDREKLEGTWEIQDHDGDWKPLDVSLNPPA